MIVGLEHVEVAVSAGAEAKARRPIAHSFS
jgi:hypothetical protein